jgi:glycosidase
MFFGGNLDGVTEKLPYIASLGVCCIYLSPIFRAYSNHKYDTGDYTRVDEAFGGDGALSRLVKAAKSFGIRIVLDGVFNHTGDDSVYFNRRGTYPSLGAYQSEESPYGNWYTFRRRPDDYECWWNIPILPRLRTDEPSCREFFLGKDGVIAKWTRAGVAGFRLDVADELSDSFIRGIRERLDENGEDTVLWGEVWEDASNKIAYGRRRRYYWGGELDGVMNYPLREGLLAYFRRGDTAPLRYALEEVLPAAPKAVADRQMNLLGTHDTLRILTALGGASEEGKSNDELAHLRMTKEERRLALERLKLAYLALATLPGLPCIYYGDEVGMEGYRDPFNRLPFPWHRMDGELLAYYRAVGELRGKESLYREGELRLHTLTPSRLVFSRTDGSRCAVTVINRSQSPLPIRLPKGARVLFGGVGEAGGALPPMSGAVIRMRAGDALSFSEQN